MTKAVSGLPRAGGRSRGGEEARPSPHHWGGGISVILRASRVRWVQWAAGGAVVRGLSGVVALPICQVQQ